MTQPRLLKPALYRREGTETAPEQPALLGTRCECGYVHFPPQAYGCEQCGRHGAALGEVALGGHGTVTSAATVHIHNARTDDDVQPLQAPFTVVTVQLEDGPRVRGLLADDSSDVIPGVRVRTTMVDVGRNGHAILDLRFTAAH